MKVLVAIPLLFVFLLVGNEFVRPESKAPWWYNDSQTGWEHDSKIIPVGYDEVSTFFIDVAGIYVIPWKKDEFWSYSAGSSTRYEWHGEKLLVRSLDGKMGFFSGGGYVHPPLKDDPQKTRKLIECLAHDDNGKLPTGGHVQEHNSLVQELEIAGAIVER